MTPTLPIQITCPKCGARYAAQVLSVVDVGQEPQLKPLLLRGALNTVLCPQCGTPGRVSAPLLYHDPQKELLLVYLPPELNLPMAEREKLTGNLVSALMSTVPTEQRKGYFLNPRPALTMQSLVDEILEADGITKEMRAEQRARSQLLQDMVRVLDDEAQLTALIEQNKARFDYPFFATLTAAAEGSAASGQEQLAERLLKLRELLIRRVMGGFDGAQQFVQSLDELFASVRPSLLARRERYQANMAAIIAEVLRDGCANGVFEVHDIVRASHAIVLAIHSLLPYSLSVEQLGRRDEIEAKARAISDILLNGLRSRSTEVPGA